VWSIGALPRGEGERGLEHRPEQPQRVAARLRTHQALDGHDQWFVLGQLTAVTAEEPAVNSAAMLRATASIAHPNPAQTTEEINR
jgi:hypothetical protein